MSSTCCQLSYKIHGDIVFSISYDNFMEDNILLSMIVWVMTCQFVCLHVRVCVSICLSVVLCYCVTMSVEYSTITMQNDQSHHEK